MIVEMVGQLIKIDVLIAQVLNLITALGLYMTLIICSVEAVVVQFWRLQLQLYSIVVALMSEKGI